ncbi:MAG: hypothetical protein ACHQ4H_03750 [Ktedonobacterales bacterium]
MSRAQAAQAMDYTTGSPSGFLRWSPDGRHLLVLDPPLGTLTIFGPANLPAR